MFISFTFLNRLDALGTQTTAFDIGIAIITFLGFAYCYWYFYTDNQKEIEHKL